MVHCSLVLHGRRSGVGHNHCLGPAAQRLGGVIPKVLNDDRSLLLDQVRVPLDISFERRRRLVYLDLLDGCFL